MREKQTFPHGCCGVNVGFHQVFVVCFGVLLHVIEGRCFNDTINGFICQVVSQESTDLHNFPPQILPKWFSNSFMKLDFLLLSDKN